MILLDNYDKSEKKFVGLYNTLKKHSNYISLIVLILIVSIITYCRVIIQINIGPTEDTYSYLSNALVFAGQGMGYSDLTRPPVLSFLTSILFRLGYASPTAIFAVDGAIFVFGVIGFYLLLKIRFNDIESFLGALLFVTFPVILSFAGSGLTDVPSLSFSIWAIYFTVLAVKRNSKFFYLAFPFLMVAFLTRYAIAFAIFPMLLYIIINKRLLKDFKDILIGIFLSFLIFIPVLLFFYSTFGNPLYPFFSFYGATATSSPISPENFSYNSDLFYFLFRMPIYIGIESTAVFTVMLLGIMVLGISNLKKVRSLGKRLLNTQNLEKGTKIKLVTSLILLVIFIGTLDKIFYMLSEVIFLVLLFGLYELLKSFDITDLDLHFLFLSWFMAFFVFQSVYLIKIDRYFLAMAPPISYFLILGLSKVSDSLNCKIRNKTLISNFFALILIVLILFSAAAYLPAFQKNMHEVKVADEQMNSASQWLMNHDPNYKSKMIYSDKWSAFAWYLNTNVMKMPFFKDNQMFYYGVKDESISVQDNCAFNNYLDGNNVDYYFSVRKGLNLTHYNPIKHFGDVIIYEKEP